MATAPLPSPQCREHVEPGGDQPRRQIAASSSSSSFSHIETLTNTRPGARATGGASPRAQEPILLSAGASLPAAWWCRVSRYRRREGGEGGRGEGALCVCLSLSFRLSLSEQNADRKCSCRNDSLRRRQTLTTTPSSPLHFRHRVLVLPRDGGGCRRLWCRSCEAASTPLLGWPALPGLVVFLEATAAGSWAGVVAVLPGAPGLTGRGRRRAEAALRALTRRRPSAPRKPGSGCQRADADRAPCKRCPCRPDGWIARLPPFERPDYVRLGYFCEGHNPRR